MNDKTEHLEYWIEKANHFNSLVAELRNQIKELTEEKQHFERMFYEVVKDAEAERKMNEYLSDCLLKLNLKTKVEPDTKQDQKPVSDPGPVPDLNRVNIESEIIDLLLQVGLYPAG